MNITDGMCHCKECEERTQESYLLSAECTNCEAKSIWRFRKGDMPSSGEECPSCGVGFRLVWGSTQEAEEMVKGDYEQSLKAYNEGKDLYHPVDNSGVLAYCDNCRKAVPVYIESVKAQKPNTSLFPWGDIVCTNCASILLTIFSPEEGDLKFIPKTGAIPRPPKSRPGESLY